MHTDRQTESVKIDGNRRGYVPVVAAAGALFSADTVATGHEALKHALRPHNRTLQLDTYDTIDDVDNRFDFIQSCKYIYTWHEFTVFLT